MLFGRYKKKAWTLNLVVSLASANATHPTQLSPRYKREQ